MTSARANWSYPTTIWFGAGRIADLADACAEAGMSRPLIVADPFLSGQPVMERAIAQLRERRLKPAVFDRLQGNPTSKNLDDGIAAFRSGGHDGVIAIGGGSALDVGKTVAFMAAQKRPVWDFEDIGDYWRRADAKAIAPIVAIPTTAGTGSEVGRATVITNEATHEKKIIFHPEMMPRVVIADPELTIGLPPALTAGTGMDALAHNLEAYFSPVLHPMADAIAVEGTRLLRGYLVGAYRQGSDIEARANVMIAAMMGAVSFQKGLGAIHSLSHPIGAIYGFHHGLTNAVLMPYVLQSNRPAISGKARHLARCIGLECDGDGLPDGFDALLQWVLQIRSELGIPHTLEELGVRREDFGKIAEMAVRDPTAGTNPVPLTVPSLLGILEAAYGGGKD